MTGTPSSAHPAGTRIGPYEVLGFIGAGGMGEVYRVRDTRLGREAALKVLPASLAADSDRRARFEREARAVAAVQHPNVVVLFDAGVDGEIPWIAFELLRGTTLAQQIARRGPLPAGETADLIAQAARGLAAAHAQNVLHRDLKPDNLFLTRDGRLKILDFGIARVIRDPSGHGDRTLTQLPAAGVPGTASYMSPEQVRGEPADARSDIFALGAVSYELLSGRKAFDGPTAAETMTMILRETPPDISPAPPAPLAAIVQRCLEKSPDSRFQSAADVGFALDAISSGTIPARRARILDWRAVAALVLALAVGGAAGAMWLRSRAASPAEPEFTRLTFRNGAVTGGRLGPGTDEVTYSARWEDDEAGRVFTSPIGAIDSRPIDVGGARLLALSATGEMALLVRPAGAIVPRGTLARLPRGAQAPREIADAVQDAAWSPGGELAAVRWNGSSARLEYPIGHVLFEARPPSWIEHPAFSPDGRRIAFLLHDVQRFDQAGGVAVVDVETGRTARVLTDWTVVNGLAWAPAGLLVSGDRDGRGIGSVFAIDARGRTRGVLNAPDSLQLLDAGAERRLLVAREHDRIAAIVQAPGDTRERDLSWQDGSWVRDLSADGRLLLFDEEADAGGAHAGVYVRSTSGAPAVRLGDGHAVALSSDGRFALARLRFTTPSRWLVLPTGPGQPHELRTGAVTLSEVGAFLPDDRELLIMGSAPGRPARMWRIPADGGGAPGPATPEGIVGRVLSPDGRSMMVRIDGRWHVFDLENGRDAGLAAGVRDDDQPLRFGTAAGELFVGEGYAWETIVRVDLAAGTRRVVTRIPRPDAVGLLDVTPPRVSADGTAYAYTTLQAPSDLFLVRLRNGGW
jgi:hypothetical protein